MNNLNKIINDTAEYSMVMSKEKEELKKAKTDKERKRIKEKYRVKKVMARCNMADTVINILNKK